MTYKFLEHTADIKFLAEGKTLEEAFESAAMALKEVITKKTPIEAKQKRKMEIKGDDLSNLLYKFLEEFLFLLDSEGFVLSKIDKISIRGMNLQAEISGDNARNYKISNDVKAVTYNNMFVRKEKGRFVCQVVLDV